MLQAEITTDGTTVWVNTDICLGRFGKKAVDVHHVAEGQIAGFHCLDCFHRSGDLDADWERFKASMLRHHNVVIDDQYRPDR